MTAGDKNTLYFAAGPNGEQDGVFGKITANPEGTIAAKATLVGDVLQITGGRDGDHILVRDGFSKQIIVQAEGRQIGSINADSIATIEFHGFSGNDSIIIASRLKVKEILNGGSDNDTIIAGAGPSVLLRGPGNDLLIGGSRRNILIGGTGRDTLIAGRGDDILIGGSTVHDANSAALLQILAEWNSDDSFDVRKDKLTNGTGGLPKLDDTTVVDDGARDFLFGGPGHDWLFSCADDLSFDV